MAVLHNAGYSLSEALVSLRRGWSVALLAILTIATSLFVLGIFLLVSHNLRGLVRQWESQARLVLYFEAAAPSAEIAALERQVAALEAVREVVVVDRDAARTRFERLFPSLEGALDGDEEPVLPASLEVWPAPGRAAEVADHLQALLAAPRAAGAVSLVDDDRDWLAQIDALVRFLGFLGASLGVALLAAAVFTIAAVIRLAFHQHREEVAVMRLVGAAESAVRGPFYVSGLLQGLAGGLLALLALYAGLRAVAPRVPASLFAAVLEGGFLPPLASSALVAVGGAAGLLGAVLSLRHQHPTVD